jgi:hypothetical protein
MQAAASHAKSHLTTIYSPPEIRRGLKGSKKGKKGKRGKESLFASFALFTLFASPTTFK